MTVKDIVQTRYFDSCLGRPDAEDNATNIEVTLRLQFTAVDAKFAPDLSGKRFNAQPWSDGEARQFIEDFRAIVEKRWSDRIYILLPDATKPREALSRTDYQRFINPRLKATREPYLRCMLRVLPVDKNPHLNVAILNIVPGQGRFQARAWRPGEKPEKAQFDMTLGDDALKAKSTVVGDMANDVCWQIPAVHEVGHLLGLQHVNAGAPACRKNHNDPICYGDTPYDSNDVMGVGDAVTGDHAKTWLEAIRLHTLHDAGWKASHLSPAMMELLQPASTK